METKTLITVETTVNAPVARVWTKWITPVDITNWYNASPDWHTPRAENDMKVGGKFDFRMEAKDGSFCFDFTGVYDTVKTNELIESTLGDGRSLIITFSEVDGKTTVVETFEAEGTHPVEMQRGGWQAILDNFKKYVEEN